MWQNIRDYSERLLSSLRNTALTYSYEQKSLQALQQQGKLKSDKITLTSNKESNKESNKDSNKGSTSHISHVSVHQQRGTKQDADELVSLQRKVIDIERQYRNCLEQWRAEKNSLELSIKNKSNQVYLDITSAAVL